MRESKKKELKKKVRRKIAKRVLLTSGTVAVVSGVASRVLSRKQQTSS